MPAVMSVSAGQQTLDVHLRLARPQELKRWHALVARYHYLHSSRMVGNRLYYVATIGEQWVALLGWAAPALKCAARDQWIGWSAQLRHKRLHLLANNVRFLILPGWHRPNLASRVLAQNLKRLSADWLRRFGHPIVLAETFVDACRFQGTCYRAAGWKVLGKTRGFSKHNRTYRPNGQPKWILVRPLIECVSEYLCAPFLAPLHADSKEVVPMVDVNKLPLEGQGGLVEMLRQVTDPRKPRGVRHSVATILAIAVCAILSGARSFTALGQWAQGLGAEALEKLGSKRGTPPSEPTIRRVLQRIDPEVIDQHIVGWLKELIDCKGKAIAVDGKTLRRACDSGTNAPRVLSAVLHQEGLVISQIPISDKTNEIPKLREILEPLDIEGSVVTADALHTQKETARFLVEQKGADYLFTVKDNQPTLRQDIEELFTEDIVGRDCTL
jgi:hypothetical protein